MALYILNNNTKTIGKIGENLAAKYLEKNGFKILQRNWQAKFGEIDIIAQKDNTTYFIEIKTQYKSSKTSPIDEITPRKIAKLKSLVKFYASTHPKIFKKLMLSGVCIVLDKNQKNHAIKWINNLLD